MRKEFGSSKRTVHLLAAFLVAALSCRNAAAVPIYGEDDRRDYHEIGDAGLRKIADSVAAFFKADSVHRDLRKGVARLDLNSFAAEEGLCPDVKFADQNTGSFCSGALVAPDTVLTAAHCVTSGISCSDLRIVFGYAIGDKDGKTPSSIPLDNVYSCVEFMMDKGWGIVGSPAPGPESMDFDWALLKLDRKVKDRAPIKIVPSPHKMEWPENTSIFTMGYPNGLPLKKGSGIILDSQFTPLRFRTNLDNFPGASGSPVFAMETNMIIGVVSGGDKDFFVYKERGATELCGDYATLPERPTEGRVGTIVVKPNFSKYRHMR